MAEYVNTVEPMARDPIKTRRSDRPSHLAGLIFPPKSQVETVLALKITSF